MARMDVPFEVGSRVKRYAGTTAEPLRYKDYGDVVVGYTYWGTGHSVLTVNDTGEEREWVNGGGLLRA